jgi:predicted transcriptional regulator
MDVEAMRARLRELGRSNWPEVERRSGIALSTIKKVAYGQTKDPGLSTAIAIEKALGEMPVPAEARS